MWGATMTDDEAEKLTAEIAELRAELQLQKDIVAELLKRIYGAKSEKIDTAQLLLDLLGDGRKKPDAAGCEDAPAAEPEPGKEKPAPKKRRRQRLRDSLKALPTVTTEIIPDEVLAAPGDYRRIDQEISERLEVSPAAFTRHVTVRPTYVRKGDPEAKPTTAPLPPALLEGSVLTASLGAHLLTEKFCYHQPFWRQEWRLRATCGIELSRNLMCHWHNHLADQLLPVYDLIASRLRASDYLKVDETPIKYLDPGTGKTSTGQFWVYHHAEHGPLYDWHTSRANTCLERVLRGGPGEAPVLRLPAERRPARLHGLHRPAALGHHHPRLLPGAHPAKVRRGEGRPPEDHRLDPLPDREDLRGRARAAGEQRHSR